MAGLLDFPELLRGLLGGQAPPQQMPQQQQASPFNYGGGNAGAAFQNLIQTKDPFSAIGNAFLGATTGQRTDPVGMYQQMAETTYRALVEAGVPEPQARLGATNPEVQKAITAKMFPTYSAHNVNNTAGSFNPATGQFTPQYIAPEYKTRAPGEEAISYQPPLMNAAPGPMGVPRPAPVQTAPLAPPPGGPQAAPVPGGPGPAPGSPALGGTQVIAPGMPLQDIEAAKTQGKIQGQTAAGLLPLQTQTQTALGLVDQLQKHPGKKYAIGRYGPIPLGKLPSATGTQQGNFLALLGEAQAGIFRQAAHDLRGLGALSNTEGSKLESSVARLSREQTPEAFDQALNEYRTYLQKGWQNAQSIAQGKMKPFTDAIPPPGFKLAPDGKYYSEAPGANGKYQIWSP